MSDTSPLLIGVGATLSGLAVVLVLLAIFFQPLLVFVALVLGTGGYLIWLQGTGRALVRTPGGLGFGVRERVGERAGEREAAGRGNRAGGPRASREEWARQQWRERRERGGDPRAGGAFRDGGRRRQRTAPPDPGSGPSVAEAREILGVEAGSDPDQVRAAYRRKVKETHPDAEGGSEEAFKRVQAAYEALSDRQ